MIGAALARFGRGSSDGQSYTHLGLPRSRFDFDVTLMRGDLRSVPQAIALSKATMRTIRQNLFWAFAYNVVLIPVAIGVLYPFESVPESLRSLHPVLAALAMALSSVTVVTNSLRLRHAKLTRIER